jgi:hypothetical protein
MEYENQLLPILREGVDVVKMILFKRLREYLSRKYPDSGHSYINKLSGAIINDLFGGPNPDQVFVGFAEKNKSRIDEELRNIPTEFEKLRIPLTDALRVQFLCDHQEGIDSSAVLRRARELGILISDREVPLPAKFVSLVRKLGSADELLMDVRDNPTGAMH